MLQHIDLNALSVEQVMEFQRSVNEELEHFGSSLQALTQAQSKFAQCIANIQQVDALGAGQPMLVPLSLLLYVPGTVGASGRYLVDVGTGYYVEKTSEEAEAFYKRKIEKLDLDAGQLRGILESKLQLLQSVTSVLRTKLSQRQQQQATKA